MEDYLEMITRNCLKEGYTRTSHLAEQLCVQASSVSKIIQKLSQLGLINYQKYGIIQLTDRGREAGLFLIKRHGIIEEFLIKLGVEETLLRDTEMIEHSITLDTLDKIELLNKFLNGNPEIVEKFDQFKISSKNQEP